MDEQHNGFDQPGEPVGPETDDSANPTDAAPEEGRSRAAAGREMLVQLQQMIDTVTVQAGPWVRDVAAKAAELAAVAGEKAGPIAHRAADATEQLGQKVAARSKEMAADWRRDQPGEAGQDAAESAMDSLEQAGDALDQSIDNVHRSGEGDEGSGF
jgi:hypothetical protein